MIEAMIASLLSTLSAADNCTQIRLRFRLSMRHYRYHYVQQAVCEREALLACNVYWVDRVLVLKVIASSDTKTQCCGTDIDTTFSFLPEVVHFLIVHRLPFLYLTFCVIFVLFVSSVQKLTDGRIRSLRQKQVIHSWLHS